MGDFVKLSSNEVILGGHFVAAQQRRRQHVLHRDSEH